MALPPPSKEVIQFVREEYGLNEQRIKEAVSILQNWLKLQPHLPDQYDEAILERWIIRCKNSLEKVKKSLETYFILKTKMPDLLNGWSTKEQWFRSAYDNLIFFPLPELTPKRQRVIIWAIRNPDPELYLFKELIMIVFMIIHIRMREEYCSSDIYVLDMKNFSLPHGTKVNFAILKQAQLCIFNSFQVRLSSINVINMPPYAEFLVGWIKILLSDKMMSRVKFYKDYSEMYDIIPKHILPKEYGGSAGTIAELSDLWLKKLRSYDDWFARNDHLKYDETKRPEGNKNCNEYFGIEGSFRKLEID